MWIVFLAIILLYSPKGRRFAMSSKWFSASSDFVRGVQKNNKNNNNPGHGDTGGGRDISNPAKTTTVLRDVT